ncbi:MAG: DNA modification methylase, partial [Betaproteobacteria bacterium]|nr:DNA modification methylase [Betaproteobacteria bacterium]
MKLLRQFDQIVPIIIDANNTIVDGHAVLDALKELGHDQIATITVANRSSEEIQALRLALNRLPEEGDWDSQRLKSEFKELLEIGFDLELTGFDQVEIDMALSIDDLTSGVVEDPPASLDPDETVVSKIGDIWLLNHHRVLCGDARDRTSLISLFDSELARMMFADPPYNVAIDGHVSGSGKTKHRTFAMACGEMSETEFQEFLTDFLRAATENMTDGAIAFVCMDWRHIEILLQAGREAKVNLKNIITWVKSNAGMGNFYRSAHEFIPVFKWGNAPHINTFELGNKGRSRSNVWQYRG